VVATEPSETVRSGNENKTRDSEEVKKLFIVRCGPAAAGTCIAGSEFRRVSYTCFQNKQLSK
jgi:hypothetical protein